MTAIVETPNLLIKHHLSMLVRSMALILAFAWLGARAAESPSYPPTKFPDTSGWGRNIQRTMLLLATSTAERRNTVRRPIFSRPENVSCQDCERRVS